ncbi:MAG: hypothetical protein LBB65_05880, partial [Burkholderiales bacterium]|nr:hypothetical protein [Burkholderiales bacterium]
MREIYAQSEKPFYKQGIWTITATCFKPRWAGRFAAISLSAAPFSAAQSFQFCFPKSRNKKFTFDELFIRWMGKSDLPFNTSSAFPED